MGWLDRLRGPRLDREQVRKAIEEAERMTSGEIVVSIAPFFLGSVDKAAGRAFRRLKVANTRERNGVLFFLVPRRRQFVILGDVGIHQRVGQAYWDELVQEVSQRIRQADLTAGLIAGVEEVGRRLAKDFPYDPVQDVNELSDAIDG